MDPRAESLAVKRLRVFARICFVWGVILVLRLVDLQIFDHEKYRKYADSQHIRKVEVQAARGAIYDRNEEPLAMSVQVDTVVVNPLRIPDPAVAADLLDDWDVDRFVKVMPHDYRRALGLPAARPLARAA